MKKLTPWLVALVLMALLAVPALASSHYRYAIKDGVKVYDEPSRHGDVLYRLDKGDEIEYEEKRGDWYGFYDGGDMCWVQKKYMTSSPVCDHEWGRWKVTRMATCTRTGKRERECELCGEVETQDIKKLPHDFGEWLTLEAATCTAEGSRIHICRACNYTETSVIPKLPHSYGSWSVTKAPTCTAEGLQMHKCAVCGFEEVLAVAKTPHPYGEWTDSVPVTDHSMGVRIHTCTACGRSETQVYDPEGTLRRNSQGEAVRAMQKLLCDQNYLSAENVNGVFDDVTERAVMTFQRVQGLKTDGIAWPQTQQRLQHEFSEWTTVVPLSRYADGVRARTCTICGYQEREIQTTAPTFLRGARGEGVRTLQEMLNGLGYDAGGADGIYGNKLDAAFGAFANGRGLSFGAGRICPANVDALVNAWLTSQIWSNWHGEGNQNSPVILTLNVSPVRNAPEAVGDTLTFSWSLVNLGSQKCRLRALLMGFGEDHSFTGDNIVAAIDGSELAAFGGNRLSGTFTVGTDWGNGETTLCFSALGTSGSNDKWLSNTVQYVKED